ncbi:MAG: hypothetical protein GY756_26360 [bacterium]|nr:hypothetical protein [bacterium]
MNFIKSFRSIFNYKTIIVLILSVVSTYLCIHFEYFANFPLTLVGIAVVFPIVFSISGAYKRRETALRHYGVLKAHGRAIYFASRDWVPDSEDKYQEQLKELLKELLIACRNYFKTPGIDDKEKEVYSLFTELSLFIKKFRERGLASGEVSRSNQYLSKMIDAFESMKHIYQYRTPVTLRFYSKIFVVLVPIVYGPYFAHLGKDIALWLSFIMPVLFSMVLVSLDNIQDQLENPFDQVGEDDISINAEKFSDNLELISELPSMK